MADVLFAEDDDPKRENVSAYLRHRFEYLDVSGSRSVRSTIDSLRADAPDLLLLDMSLPTFDISRDEGGGRPQSAGGIEILDFMSYSGLTVPTIIITQHEAFDYNGVTIGLMELRSRLTVKYRELFRAMVQYNTINGLWKSELSVAVFDVVKDIK